jgi:hypothetical protein
MNSHKLLKNMRGRVRGREREREKKRTYLYISS